ncbi:MAG: hypothetical protein LBP56_02050 [Odoribacteraceae bacterium]|jgi:hypothetical protein|nr:hypothetical protein [Odoribacteraceae bacterium]
MDYKFDISLPNSSDFRCEIAIGGEQTFQQFHDKLVETLGYDSAQMASFFTLDRLGNRVKEIALMDMAGEDDENDTLVMDSTEISDVVKPGCLELEYVFDFFANRYFKIEYAGEYIRDSSDIMPVCVSCTGTIPEQFSYNADKEEWEFEDPAEEYDASDYDDSFMQEFGNNDYDDEGEPGYDDEGGEERYESLDDYIDRL